MAFMTSALSIMLSPSASYLLDQGVPGAGRGPGDGGRPSAVTTGVDRPHLHVVLRAIGQPGQGVPQGIGAGRPDVFQHGPVGVGLIGGPRLSM